MKHVLFACALALGTATPAFAQHAGHGSAKPAASAAAAPTDGEIRRIDKTRGTVLMKHGELKNLGMGAMTMSFKFKDPAMASQFKEGDKVKFTAEQKGEELIITSISRAP